MPDQLSQLTDDEIRAVIARDSGSAPQDKSMPKATINSPSAIGDISDSEKWVEPKGSLDTALEMLDYSSNVGRSFASGMIEGGVSKGLEYAGQAVRQERKISSDRFFDRIAEKKNAKLLSEVQKWGDSHPGVSPDILQGIYNRGKTTFKWGEDNGKFDMGDILDFGSRLAVDFLADPVTYLTLGVGKVVQAGAKGVAQTAKIAEAVTPGLVERGVLEAAKGLATPDAIKYLKYKEAGQHALGAMYGAGLMEPDDTMPERMAKIAGGGVSPYIAKKALPHVKGAMRETGDALTNAWGRARGMSPSAEMTTAEAIRTSGKAVKRKWDAAQAIVLNRKEILDGMSDWDKIRFTNLFQKTKNEFVNRREPAIKALEGERDRVVSAANQALADGKISQPAFNKYIADAERSLGTSRRNLDQRVTKEMGPVFNQYMQDEAPHIAKAATEWVKHNESIVADINRFRYGLKNGQLLPDDPRGLFGIKWHIDDVYEYAKELDGVGINQGELALARKKLDASAFDLSQAVAEGKMNKRLAARVASQLDARYQAYAKNISHSMTNDFERKAIQIAQDFKQLSTVKGVRQVEQVMHGFDKLTQFSKTNMLMFGFNWLNNTMWENVYKTAIEGGFLPALGMSARTLAGSTALKTAVGATAGASIAGEGNRLEGAAVGAGAGLGLSFFRDEVSKGIRSILNNEQSIKGVSKDALDARRYGALDGIHFTSVMNKELEDFAKNPTDLQSMFKDKVSKWAHFTNVLSKGKETAGEIDFTAAAKGAIPALAKGWMNSLQGTVGKLGSYMEAHGRIAVYRASLKTVMKNPAMDGLTTDAKKRIAADYTKRVFFDYADISNMERAVAQRLVPFWNFYSRNIPYWVKNLYDVDKIRKIKAVNSLYNEIGTEVSAEEKKYLSPYVKGNHPRFVGELPDGTRQYAIAPQNPLHDAIQTISPHHTGILRQMMEKSNPLLKLIPETAIGMFAKDGGTDFFTADWKDFEIPEEMRAANPDMPESIELFKGQPSVGKPGYIKNLFSGGVKYYWMSEFFGKHFPSLTQKFMKASGLDEKYAMDSKGHPKTTSAWLSVLDNMSETFFPHGLINWMAASAMKVDMDKKSWMELLGESMKPIRTIEMSPEAEAFNIQEELKAIKNEFGRQNRVRDRMINDRYEPKP